MHAVRSKEADSGNEDHDGCEVSRHLVGLVGSSGDDDGQNGSAKNLKRSVRKSVDIIRCSTLTSLQRRDPMLIHSAGKGTNMPAVPGTDLAPSSNTLMVSE